MVNLTKRTLNDLTRILHTLLSLSSPAFHQRRKKVEQKIIILFDSILGLGFQFTFHEYFGIMNREEMDERKST